MGLLPGGLNELVCEMWIDKKDNFIMAFRLFHEKIFEIDA